MITQVKTPDEIKSMQRSGRILAAVLKALSEAARPGMSTLDLSRLAEKELARLGGKPAFKGYHGFPESLCVSVNDEVIHGIPKADHILREGDVVSCDFGVTIDGMITDAATTFILGPPASAKDIELVNVTRKATKKAVEAVRPDGFTGDIGAAAQRVLEGASLGIVREFVGHGVGHFIHEEPGIPNYGQAGTGFKLEPGMTIAIEPMATLGDGAIYIDKDGWTVKTGDGSRAAHFEHTVLVTEDGYEILTA